MWISFQQASSVPPLSLSSVAPDKTDETYSSAPDFPKSRAASFFLCYEEPVAVPLDVLLSGKFCLPEYSPDLHIA